MGSDFVVIGVLKGSFVFLADLVRALARAGATPSVEFMRLASYGQKKESSGEVLLLGDVPRDFGGRAVLLVDDIVDTGLSMDYGKRLLTERNAARVWTCALLDKPSRRKVDVTLDFVGFEIPDVFVVGYGIDYAEQYRYLPYIGKASWAPAEGGPELVVRQPSPVSEVRWRRWRWKSKSRGRLAEHRELWRRAPQALSCPLQSLFRLRSSVVAAVKCRPQCFVAPYPL